MNKKILFILCLFAGLCFGKQEKAFAADEFDSVEEVKTAPAEEASPAPEAPQMKMKAQRRVCKCEFHVDTPYKERRTRWGGTFGFQWGAFIPLNYRPTFTATSFDSLYGGRKTGSAEVAFSAKLNFFLGSIGPQITAGYFNASNTASQATLTIMPITAGLIFALDNVLKEPYVVPYATAGMYTGLYTEIQGGLTVTGNTPIAPFYSAGLMFQLDWMDEDSHESGYEEYGMENTFLYVEGRSFLQSTSAVNTAADLSTPLQLFAGLKTEF